LTIHVSFNANPNLASTDCLSNIDSEITKNQIILWIRNGHFHQINASNNVFSFIDYINFVPHRSNKIDVSKIIQENRQKKQLTDCWIWMDLQREREAPKMYIKYVVCSPFLALFV
jgi:hypothetical protein